MSANGAAGPLTLADEMKADHVCFVHPNFQVTRLLKTEWGIRAALVGAHADRNLRDRDPVELNATKEQLQKLGRDGFFANMANIPAGTREVQFETELPASAWYGDAPAEPPAALIKGVLPQTGVAMIGGPSGAGKTFHAIHLAACLIPQTEKKFYIDRYPIRRKGGVLYFVLEGKASFQLRLAACFEGFLGADTPLLRDRRLPFAWNTYSPRIFENGADDLIQLAERDAKQMRADFGVEMVAIGIDTMGLAACYENEDKAAQVQKVISALGRLGDATGALAIGVDHFGKDLERGLRGSTAKRGHAETVLSCLADRSAEGGPATNHRMVFEKLRDGEDEGRVVPYRLQQVQFGVDEDGEPVTTCRVVWDPDRKIETGERRKPGRRAAEPDAFKAALEAAMAESGKVIRPNGKDVRAVDRNAVIAAFTESTKPGSAGTVLKRWQRALKAAIELGQVVREDVGGATYLRPSREEPF